MMHPLDMPETLALAARVSFDIARVDYAAPEASGRQGGVQAGWPLWMARWEMDRVDPVLGDLWRGFHARLRGRQRLFFGWDTTRPFPLAHRRGFDGMRRPDNSPFIGAATGWAQNVDGDGNAQIALTGLPAGLRLSIGDYVGLRWDAAGAVAGTHGRRALVRVVVGAAASAAGAITVMVEPPIDTRVVPARAQAHLDRPSATFRADPDETRPGIMSGGSLAGIALVAAQDLRP